jgi:hypothetical protein
MKNICTSLFITALVAMPRFVLAASDTDSVTLINPLGETDVRLIFGRVIAAALSIIGSAALLMFVYGGVTWMTSRGEPKAVTKGKDTMTWAILGLVVVFASYAIVNALISGLTAGTVS